ncbi:tail fiber assembly protein [Salmonella enterica]|nr:tail fiber assembly protein [Salmonella enterica subsp. diarizonae]ELE1935831.1 tail fiber assembly protein [Salmonella enterica]
MKNMNSRYSLSPETAVIGNNGLSVNSGWITVYHAGPDGEYTGASNDYLMRGVGLAAGAYADAPVLPTEPGKAVRRSADKTQWEIVADHRGKTAWNITTREPVKITFMGEIPASLTFIPPSGEFDTWDGEKWVTDETAQKNAAINDATNKKTQLLTDIRNTIGIWQTQLQLGSISEENKSRLEKWLDYYNQIDTINPENAPDINWPDLPEQ